MFPERDPAGTGRKNLAASGGKTSLPVLAQDGFTAGLLWFLKAFYWLYVWLVRF